MTTQPSERIQDIEDRLNPAKTSLDDFKRHAPNDIQFLLNEVERLRWHVVETETALREIMMFAGENASLEDAEWCAIVAGFALGTVYRVLGDNGVGSEAT